MKKFFFFLLGFFMLSNYSFSQIRITEMGGETKGNFIELYTPSTTTVELKNWNIVVYNNGDGSWRNIDLGAQVSTIGGVNISDRYYLVTSAPAKTTNPNRTVYSSAQIGYNVNSSDFLSNGGVTFVVFLLNKGKIIDVVATKTTQAAAQQIVSTLGSGPQNLVVDSEANTTYNVNFSSARIGLYSYVNYSFGSSGSLALTSGSGNCGTWIALPNSSSTTPKANNSSSEPIFYYFDADIYYLKDKTASSPWLSLPANNTLPQSGSFTSNPFSLKFRYEISNHNIPSVGLTTPSFDIYVDGDGNDILDESLASLDEKLILGSDYTVSLISSTSTLTIVEFTITSSTKLGGAINTKSLFFKFATSPADLDGTCFDLQKLMMFPEALPVSIKTFSINTISKSNNLKWVTSTEQNNKGFEIQKSVANGQDFRTIGFVGTRAKDGNSNTEISYSFEDTDVKAGTMHYYRLKQVDFDGKFTFSAIKSIKPGSIESNLSVYPNPSQGSFTLTTGASSGKVNVFLLDNTGRVINQYMNVTSSNTKFNNLKKGFYTLKIVDVETGEQSAQRVVVQ
jgi:hypothetical protein